MYCRYKDTLASLSCALALSILPMTSMNLSATEADNTAAAIAERGGGGGARGGAHYGGSHFEGHSNYHPAATGAHDNYHPNVNRDYNNYNRNAWEERDAFNAGWEDGAAVPEGEYVYPGTVTSPTSGDMDTLYDYENSTTNQATPNQQ